MIASPSIKIHILRGILGFFFLALILNYSAAWGWWTLLPAIGALIAFGGCPMCWIVGFASTILNGKPVALCLDGSCAGRRPSPQDFQPSNSTQPPTATPTRK